MPLKLLMARFLWAKSQGLYKAENYLMSKSSTASAKALQRRKVLLDKKGRDLDLQRQQPAEIMDLQQAVQTAEAAASPAGIMERVQRDALQFLHRQLVHSIQREGYSDAQRERPERWSMLLNLIVMFVSLAKIQLSYVTLNPKP